MYIHVLRFFQLQFFKTITCTLGSISITCIVHINYVSFSARHQAESLGERDVEATPTQDTGPTFVSAGNRGSSYTDGNRASLHTEGNRASSYTEGNRASSYTEDNAGRTVVPALSQDGGGGSSFHTSSQDMRMGSSDHPEDLEIEEFEDDIIWE